MPEPDARLQCSSALLEHRLALRRPRSSADAPPGRKRSRFAAPFVGRQRAANRGGSPTTTMSVPSDRLKGNSGIDGRWRALTVAEPRAWPSGAARSAPVTAWPHARQPSAWPGLAKSAEHQSPAAGAKRRVSDRQAVHEREAAGTLGHCRVECAAAHHRGSAFVVPRLLRRYVRPQLERSRSNRANRRIYNVAGSASSAVVDVRRAILNAT